MFPEMLSLINEAVSEELRNNQKDKTDGQIEFFLVYEYQKNNEMLKQIPEGLEPTNLTSASKDFVNELKRHSSCLREKKL